MKLLVNTLMLFYKYGRDSSAAYRNFPTYKRNKSDTISLIRLLTQNLLSDSDGVSIANFGKHVKCGDSFDMSTSLISI